MAKTVFVSVGTTRFDKLCDKILAKESLDLFESKGYRRVVMQVGNSRYDRDLYAEAMRAGFDVVLYEFKPSIEDDIAAADLVVSHAGAGTCLEVLDLGKPLLVVINDELMDNHQTEIAERLHADGHLYYCTCETFHRTFDSMDVTKLKPYPKADATRLFRYLDEYLGFE